MEQELKKQPNWFGVALIVIGSAIFLEKVFKLDLFFWLKWEYFWPVLLILLGVHIVTRK